LPKPLEVPVMTMVRGTIASSVEVTSWDTLGPPSPRPNPQNLRLSGQPSHVST
jgi:hypothetical protein